MSKKSQYISTNRSKHYLKCHLILVTKYRRNILVGQLNDDLKDIFTSIANNSDFEIEVMESDIKKGSDLLPFLFVAPNNQHTVTGAGIEPATPGS